MRGRLLAGALALMLLLTGCGAKAEDLMRDIRAREVTSEPVAESTANEGAAITGLGVGSVAWTLTVSRSIDQRGTIRRGSP